MMPIGQMDSRYEEQLKMYRKSIRGQLKKGGPPTSGLNGELTTPHHEN
jgi:hypothetical protein